MEVTTIEPSKTFNLLLSPRNIDDSLYRFSLFAPNTVEQDEKEKNKKKGRVDQAKFCIYGVVILTETCMYRLIL